MSMRWYDFQINNIKPKIPKNKISCNLHKFSSNKLSLHIIQSICNNLVGQAINTHNNMYNVWQRVTRVACATSKKLEIHVR